MRQVAQVIPQDTQGSSTGELRIGSVEITVVAVLLVGWFLFSRSKRDRKGEQSR